MKRIIVEIYDQRNGATSYYDDITVNDDYTVADYRKDLESNYNDDEFEEIKDCKFIFVPYEDPYVD